IELQDVYIELESLLDQLEADPNRLEVVSAKLQILHNLMLKHSVSDDSELIQIKNDLNQKVSDTENLDQLISEKASEINTIQNQLESLSNSIHEKRVKSIPSLTSQIEAILDTLGMPNA